MYKNSEEIYAFNTSFKKHDNITYCWPTSSIEGINIATTQGLAINKIEKMPVYNLNINSNGDKLLYKYSLLVKQCAISSEVYNTLRLVKDFSEDDATLFATQPGFVKGNMYNPNNKEERVIGLFYATEIKGRRIFILPHELDSKDYRIVSSLDENCGSIQIAVPNKNCPGHPSFKALKDSLSSGKNIINVYKEDQETRYILSNIPCLDCRVKGSNIKPEWWGEIAE